MDILGGIIAGTLILLMGMVGLYFLFTNFGVVMVLLLSAAAGIGFVYFKER